MTWYIFCLANSRKPRHQDAKKFKMKIFHRAENVRVVGRGSRDQSYRESLSLCTCSASSGWHLLFLRWKPIYFLYTMSILPIVMVNHCHYVPVVVRQSWHLLVLRDWTSFEEVDLVTIITCLCLWTIFPLFSSTHSKLMHCRERTDPLGLLYTKVAMHVCMLEHQRNKLLHFLHPSLSFVPMSRESQRMP